MRWPASATTPWGEGEGESQPTVVPAHPPSPLLQTLDRIADALESIAADVESFNRRDSVWRAS